MWVIFYNYNANDIMKSAFEDADPHYMSCNWESALVP